MSLLTVVAIVWFASEIILSRLRRSTSSKDHDKSSLKIIWITVIFSITAGGYLGNLEMGQISDNFIFIYYSGISIIICGLAIRWWAILTLKKSFTVTVSIHEKQQLIKTGIYNFIRHPSYTGSILSFVGLGIAFNSWISIIVISIPITLAFITRIKIEENVLIEAFGDDYVQYCKKTSKLIPGVF